MKSLIKKLLITFDYFLFVPVILSGIILKFIRKAGMQRMKISRFFLVHLGVFPILDHYYEPLFNKKKLSTPLSTKRKLSGIEWNLDEQLKFLEHFSFTKEILDNDWKTYSGKKFYFGNGSIESGDAEYLYNLIRYLKPKKIIEVGSGFSTLIIKQATEKNKLMNIEDACEITCIEPYEQSWLNKLDINLLRERVENVEMRLFEKLDKNDLLFIDSSHVIRPQGDVIFEILELLPKLNSGVYVHFHDIFSPYDYPEEWLFEHMRFWNEQYLLEAFLTNNSDWEIIGSLNYLSKNYFNQLNNICRFLSKDRDPGSFYIRKK